MYKAAILNAILEEELDVMDVVVDDHQFVLDIKSVIADMEEYESFFHGRVEAARNMLSFALKKEINNE